MRSHQTIEWVGLLWLRNFLSAGELFSFYRNVSWLISQTFPTKGMREYKMHLWTLNFSSVAWLKKEVQSISELPTKMTECSMCWYSNQAYYDMTYWSFQYTFRCNLKWYFLVLIRANLRSTIIDYISNKLISYN